MPIGRTEVRPEGTSLASTHREDVAGWGEDLLDLVLTLCRRILGCLSIRIDSAAGRGLLFLSRWILENCVEARLNQALGVVRTTLDER